MTSNAKVEDGEFAARVLESVHPFVALDSACEKVREKSICDALGVKCDLGCQLYVKKAVFLKFLEGVIKAKPIASVDGVFALPSN